MRTYAATNQSRLRSALTSARVFVNTRSKSPRIGFTSKCLIAKQMISSSVTRPVGTCHLGRNACLTT